MDYCCSRDVTAALSRRSFLRVGLGAAAASAAGLRLPSLLAQETTAGSSRKVKSVIMLWMGGGPSQMDTWDPKPDTKTGGPIKVIDTTLKGLRLPEGMPKIAAQARHLALLRGVTTKEGSHERGTHLLHTCFAPIPGQDFAAMGTIVASELARPGFPLPSFIAVDPPPIPPSSAFPEEHQVFTVNSGKDPVPNVRPPGHDDDEERRTEREKLLEKQNRGFEEPRGGREIDKAHASAKKASDLMSTPMLKAFDISLEPEKLREEYGDSGFGRNCLMARRLAEVGVPFIEVGLNGWDTHQNNHKAVGDILKKSLDPGMGTLIRDLDEKGLLKETLVVWMGEFGRTPEINGNQGRDHWPKCFSVAMAGAGVGGRLVGSTDKLGMDIADRPVTVPELFASIYRLMGIEENKSYVINTRKVKYSYGGKPVKELF